MRSSPSAQPDAAPAGKAPHAWLTAQPYAHRGLHGPRACENSRSAFVAAIEGGYGIELDVRLSRDGLAVVFHDAELDRLTGQSGRLALRTAAELGSIALAGTGDRIETLATILGLVAGRAALLIELKTDGDPRAAALLSASVRHALEGYRGHAAVMSFDAQVGRWFAVHAPHIARGLIVGVRARRSPRQIVRRLLHLRAARPHFLAYDHCALPSRLAANARRRGIPVLAWTVRSSRDLAIATEHADEIIFENA